MTVHLLKLAVGAASLEHLKERMALRAADRLASGLPPEAPVITRMAPKRIDEVLDGGSLYWVIKGSLSARQRVVGMDSFKDEAGVTRTQIFLDPEVVAVRPRPCRPFQGWRYLKVEEAPADLTVAAVDDAMPDTMRRELMELCLL